MGVEPSAAFAATLDAYRISTVALASSSGVSETAISRFRNGRADMRASTLFKLLRTLPPPAQLHFYAQVAHLHHPPATPAND